eukprot:TRINITY_DN13392_c0_g1_i1.p1 TRINITY_DN13392_c0_g1~~TRINITY_DN13392_c0_g1_i1.p1  ORF type:complete len:763 (+),score=207.19 TRINITY_DN13392_c0_g1_i1:88-2289(+)
MLRVQELSAVPEPGGGSTLPAPRSLGTFQRPPMESGAVGGARGGHGWSPALQERPRSASPTHSLVGATEMWRPQRRSRTPSDALAEKVRSEIYGIVRDQSLGRTDVNMKLIGLCEKVGTYAQPAQRTASPCGASSAGRRSPIAGDQSDSGGEYTDTVYLDHLGSTDAGQLLTRVQELTFELARAHEQQAEQRATADRDRVSDARRWERERSEYETKCARLQEDLEAVRTEYQRTEQQAEEELAARQRALKDAQRNAETYALRAEQHAEEVAVVRDAFEESERRVQAMRASLAVAEVQMQQLRAEHSRRSSSGRQPQAPARPADSGSSRGATAMWRPAAGGSSGQSPAAASEGPAQVPQAAPVPPAAAPMGPDGEQAARQAAAAMLGLAGAETQGRSTMRHQERTQRLRLCDSCLRGTARLKKRAAAAAAAAAAERLAERAAAAAPAAPASATYSAASPVRSGSDTGASRRPRPTRATSPAAAHTAAATGNGHSRAGAPLAPQPGAQHGGHYEPPQEAAGRRRPLRPSQIPELMSPERQAQHEAEVIEQRRRELAEREAAELAEFERLEAEAKRAAAAEEQANARLPIWLRGTGAASRSRSAPQPSRTRAGELSASLEQYRLVLPPDDAAIPASRGASRMWQPSPNQQPFRSQHSMSTRRSSNISTEPADSSQRRRRPLLRGTGAGGGARRRSSSTDPGAVQRSRTLPNRGFGPPPPLPEKRLRRPPPAPRHSL